LSLKLFIRPLDKQAKVSDFACGQKALDDYLARYASQDVRRNVARVFVATPAGDTDQLAGFYSLSAASVQCAELPAVIAKKLPHYPIPVALLGRLAVATDFQGQGAGSVLLFDACKKTVIAESVLAVAGLVVDAKDSAAGDFYRHFGFVPMEPTGRRFFLSMRVLRQLAG
jgi:GNAT superfamily N-acetyltransferase